MTRAFDAGKATGEVAGKTNDSPLAKADIQKIQVALTVLACSVCSTAIAADGCKVAAELFPSGKGVRLSG